MSLLVVGSVALDSVETPFGARENVLGGSATYFAAAASLLTKVSVVGVVGEDFPLGELDFLQKRGVSLDGLEKVPGRTFRWKGKYGFDLNAAQTLDTQLNVFEHFQPKLGPEARKAERIFLGNIDPELQMRVLEQAENPRLVCADTMNFWISGKRAALLKLLPRVDVLMVNDGEVRQLAGEANVIKAARAVQRMGAKAVVVKRGEYGAILFADGCHFMAPGYLLEDVFDPTGAGDCFAGGFIGYLAEHGFSLEGDHISRGMLSRAVIYGSVMGSFCCERFGVERFRTLTREEIDARFEEFRKFTSF